MATDNIGLTDSQGGKKEIPGAPGMPGGAQPCRAAVRLCFLCSSLGLPAILGSSILIPIPVSPVHRQFENEVNECIFKVHFCWSIVAIFGGGNGHPPQYSYLGNPKE